MHLCLKCLCKNFLRPMVFLCKRLLFDSKSFLARRTAKMSWDELRGDDKGWSVLGWDENSWKNLLRWHVRRDGMRWEERRWGKKSSHDLRWDEVSSAKCKCEVRSAGCEERSVKCEERLRLELHCTGAARRSCSWTTSVQQLRTKHARTGLAGARRMQAL